MPSFKCHHSDKNEGTAVLVAKLFLVVLACGRFGWDRFNVTKVPSDIALAQVSRNIPDSEPKRQMLPQFQLVFQRVL